MVIVLGFLIIFQEGCSPPAFVCFVAYAGKFMKQNNFTVFCIPCNLNALIFN